MKRACTFYFDNRSLIIKYSIEACIWLYNRLLVWKGRSNVPSSKILMTIWSKVSGIIHDRLNSSAISGSVKRNKSYAPESRLSLNVLMRGSLSRDRRIYLYIYNFPTPLFFSHPPLDQNTCKHVHVYWSLSNRGGKNTSIFQWLLGYESVIMTVSISQRQSAGFYIFFITLSYWFWGIW